LAVRNFALIEADARLDFERSERDSIDDQFEMKVAGFSDPEFRFPELKFAGKPDASANPDFNRMPQGKAELARELFHRFMPLPLPMEEPILFLGIEIQFHLISVLVHGGDFGGGLRRNPVETSGPGTSELSKTTSWVGKAFAS
jgi:hypothetical protein